MDKLFEAMFKIYALGNQRMLAEGILKSFIIPHRQHAAEQGNIIHFSFPQIVHPDQFNEKKNIVEKSSHY